MITTFKNLIFALGLTGITLICIAADQSKPNQLSSASDHIRLIAAMSETNYTSGDRIELSLIITNESSKPFIFNFSNHPLLDYKIRITGCIDRQDVPFTRMGNRILEGNYVTTRNKILEPGQSSTNTIVLSQVYDLTSPQTYEVNVHNLHLKAKPIQFTVQAF